MTPRELQDDCNIYMKDYASVAERRFVRHHEYMRTAVSISLSQSERVILRRWAKQDNTRQAQRARVVLLAADGWENNAIAADLGTDPNTVARWRNRFASSRLAGIEREAARSGRKRRVRDSMEKKILRLTASQRAKGEPWSTRKLAESLGVNHMLVYRVWREHGLLP